jgi:hypothetical protein
MLWYKAWLETRWTLVFTFGSMLLIWLGPPLLGAHWARPWLGFQLGSAGLYCFTALFLADSGINSQPMYGLAPGFHGSMLFTLSLPVSRRRLLFVRAGFGAILCWSAVLLLQFRSVVIARISPLRGMSLISYPATAPMPWLPLVTSVALTAVLLYSSVLVLQRKEY